MAWHEMAIVLVVVVALFRPDFILNQFSPEFEPIDLTAFAAGETSVEPGRNVRFHVVRQTDYGDRFKLFTIETPEGTDPVTGPYGVSIVNSWWWWSPCFARTSY